jgi:hypothetical protein
MITSKSTTAKKPVVDRPTATSKKPVVNRAAATPKSTAKNATPRMVTAKTEIAMKSAITDSSTKAKTAVKKQAAPAKAVTNKVSAAPSPEQRYRMVQEAAYFVAEKNGFASGSMDYWIAAEIAIDALLPKKSMKHG